MKLTHPPVAASTLILAALLLSASSRLPAIDPATLPAIGYHPSGVAYWDSPVYANALAQGSAWLEFAPFQWGTTVDMNGNPQFNADGYPQYLNPGLSLRGIVFGLHVNNENRPAGWPDRSAASHGRVVLEWMGDADIRINSGHVYLAADSSGTETGRLVNGRRVYRFDAPGQLQWIEIHDINAAAPITDIKVWQADPDDPDNASLEDQLFHPYLLDRINEADWGFIRFMNLSSINASPQQDWSDRRRPSHVFMSGVLNPRAPATGSPGDRETGIAHEHAVALCNATGKDMWICVPHLATEAYIRNLARLIRFGSDGADAYTSAQASPVHPPLDPSLRVYIEYSNEIWSNGYSFPQGDWAQEQATAAGITKPQFNARRFCEVWRIFQEEFGGADRLVRVAAVFTAADWYTGPFLQEMATFGPTLSPAVEPDVIAATTYFGNGIQDWAMQRAQQQAGTTDPWFLTTQTFDVGGGNMRPVSITAADPYWTGASMDAHLEECFAEWRRRMLSGDAQEGGGPDAVGVGGGFAQWLRDMAQTTFPTPKPIIAYEGGPSIYTDYMDAGDPRDDGVTTFMEALNRRPEMADVYSIHLNMARARGLWSHVAFTDMGRWGKYGQWGHLEYPLQDPATSPKYQFLLDWMAAAGTIRHIDSLQGSRPSFVTPHNLPVGLWNQPFSADITVTGGDGAATIERIGDYLLPGLAYDPVPADTSLVRLAGTPTQAGLSHLYLRVADADGDAAWRTFTQRTVGGPNTILEINLEGTDPALNLPWTQTYIVSPSLVYTGLAAGPGIFPAAGANHLQWFQNMPANEVDSTLALAIADGEYLSFTITPADGMQLDLRGHEMRFTIRRIDYHAPRRHALFTSIAGFAEGSELHTTSWNGETSEQEARFTLPDTAAYAGLTDPVEFRLYGYSGQYGGHDTSLTALRLDGVLAPVSGMGSDTWRVE